MTAKPVLISDQAIYLKTGKAVEICFAGETFICLSNLHLGTRIKILWEICLQLLYVCPFWINDISLVLREMSFRCHCLSSFPWIYHFHFQRNITNKLTLFNYSLHFFYWECRQFNLIKGWVVTPHWEKSCRKTRHWQLQRRRVPVFWIFSLRISCFSQIPCRKKVQSGVMNNYYS